MNGRMLLPAASCVVLCLTSLPLVAQGERLWSFDQDAVGAAHPGFLLAAMRQPTPGRWTVERQGTQGYLAHHPDPAASGYSMAMVSEPTTNDILIGVRLRFNGGVRTGGVTWRAQDHQTFYALVLDLVARELVLYKFTSGHRVQLDVEDDLELDPLAWHALKVVHEGSEVRVSLGGIGVFQERDRRFEAQAAPVRVGLLAAGAADVWFDDLRVEPKRAKR